ncbi:CTP synthetase [Agitococcus lubricus]|uniref:Uncharacterized protein n=1 Tax=Agitococcus lubricus TaxID=1077255 RepID=A0A2T5J3V1_9GAMM|nr:CTP synthetase [Agitococcus lubricus]PTQ91290.1 hypothetical protein C8N29_101363 [Agitococcus lubricus]
MNIRVASIIFTMASVVIAGIFLTVALVMGYEQASTVWWSIAAGLVVSLPITWIATNSLLTFSAKQQNR